ncbi:MAG: Nif11-like leader peptide family natural product precursor [Chitinispirillia bacterium]|nr:Nif11-like leader peptide family natural product precursor [Chitinispirillia bacterium]MCL2267708.1 Nif11-like leader peptide family natural product precursor [Chitinispirillia bacterium]
MGVADFMKKWNEDKAFVSKYTALIVDGLVEQAKKDGFGITKADAERLLGKSGELSDEELSAVAGGKTTQRCTGMGVHVG